MRTDPTMPDLRRQGQRAFLSAAVVSFIVGLTVLLSIDWDVPANEPLFNWIVLALGIALAVVVALIQGRFIGNADPVPFLRTIDSPRRRHLSLLWTTTSGIIR